MSKHETLTFFQAQIEDAETALYKVRQARSDILKPLFDEQAKLASSIFHNEEEFKGMDRYHGPMWSLNTPASPTGRYDKAYSVDSWVQECAYNDGDSSPDILLLPEFLDGTQEQKENAIRNFYRDYQAKKKAEVAAAQQRIIEKARATLAEAGITV
jgi:hypothetical protein